jgi:hypothetical protein
VIGSIAGQEQDAEFREAARMPIRLRSACVVGATGVAVLLAMPTPTWCESPWYGKKADVTLAKALWPALEKARMVGPRRLQVHAFKGMQPHANVQQVWAGNVEVEGRIARVIVKANHKKKGASVAAAYDQPDRFLSDYTVMFKAAKGYDPGNQDWFWAKYSSDGAIDRDGNGVAIAGRVDSPSGFGCAGCHRKLGGADLEVLTRK